MTKPRRPFAIVAGFEDKPAQAAYSYADREYAVLVNGSPVQFCGTDSQAAQRTANALNYELAEEGRGEERDAEAEQAARHPRYVQRGGDVVDTASGRFYCTAAAWPHSPAATSGAALGEPARAA
jgi:hypothetical protein